MILTFKIKWSDVWSADVKFADTSALEEVHHAIQQAVDFEDDHMYEFYAARLYRAGRKTRCDLENGGLTETRLCDVLPLTPKDKFF